MPAQADALLVAVDRLRGAPDVQALTGPRVYANRLPDAALPPAAPARLLVWLRRLPSRPLVPEAQLHQARIQVDCYGATAADDARAWQLATVCHAALHDLPQLDHPAGRVTDVTDGTGIASLPDRDLDRNGWARTTFDVLIAIRPHLQGA